MKKKTVVKPYVYNDQWNAIFVDYGKAREIASQLDEECIALKDETMGYGIYFTKDGTWGVYGDNPYLEELLRTYWNATTEETEIHLKHGKTKENLVRTGIIKLVACTLNTMYNKGIAKIENTTSLIGEGARTI